LSTEPLTDEQLDELQAVLEQFQNDDSVRDISELDGFFTALISSPEILPFSVWYNALWGNPATLPKWKDDKAFDNFVNLMVQHMGNLELVITEHPEQFGPIFNEELVEEDGDETMPSLQEWCYGYRRLSDSWPKELPEDQEVMLNVITLHSLGEEAYEEDELPEIDLFTAADMITHAAVQMHEYWASRRPSTTPVVRGEEKVGRNDPCPCGSGKKSKQCCAK
jgi:uncharacterized protein